MPLCAPVIAGPLNEWSSTILVTGCLPGADILIHEIGVNQRIVAKGKAVGGSDRIDLLPGEQLHRYDVLVATQELGSEKSPLPDFRMGLFVGPAPATTDDMAFPGFVSRPYECGQAAYILGVVPGAVIRISHGSNLLGSVVAHEGHAIVPVSRIPGAGNTISTVADPPTGYSISGPPKVTNTVTEPAPGTDIGMLPTPQPNQPIPVQGCSIGLALRNLVDGSVLTLVRSTAGITSAYVPHASATTLILNPTLSDKIDKLHIRQSLVDCHRNESDELVLEVMDAQKPDAPNALAPCAWSSTLYATGLQNGARVTLLVNVTPYHAMVPPDATELLLQVDPIPINSTIYLMQANCAGISLPTILSTVDSLPLKNCSVLGPLHDCGRVVRVIDAIPGSLIQIWADTPDITTSLPQPISPFIPVTSNSMAVDVIPYLNKGWLVYVQYLACGGNWRASKKILVTQAEQMVPITIIAVENDDQVIILEGLSGAFVEIYKVYGPSREFLGSGCIDPLQQRIPLIRRLRRGEKLVALQTLCARFDHSLIQDVLPARISFNLPAPQKIWSIVEPYNEFLEVKTATLQLSHNGDNVLTVDARNTEDEADVDYSFVVTLSIANRPGEKFVKELSDNLSATGNGPATLVGYRIKGIPSARIASTVVSIYPRLQDVLYWKDILQATASYRILHAFFKRPQASEPDDPDEKTNK